MDLTNVEAVVEILRPKEGDVIVVRSEGVTEEMTSALTKKLGRVCIGVGRDESVVEKNTGCKAIVMPYAIDLSTEEAGS